MAGLQVMFATSPCDDFTDQRSDDSMFPTESIEELYRDRHCAIRMVKHATYPFWVIDDTTHVTVFEGIVYNLSDEELRERISAIVTAFSHGQPYADAVGAFVEQADGEFIVFAYSKQKHSCICFNDLYARLPFYYYHDASRLMLSRRIGPMLPCIPVLSLDPQAIAVFMAFEYQFGNGTFFHEVKRAVHAQLITAVASPRQTSRISTSIETTVPVCFDETAPIRSKQQCVKEFSSLFVNAVSERYQKAHEHGYGVTVDVSGGYDTRAVCMAMSRLGYDARYYTHHLITGDETRAACSLGDVLGKDVTVIDVSHSLSNDDMESMVFLTDMQVNGWTTLSCWQEYLARFNQMPPQSVILNGLGGGYFRHPYRKEPGFTSPRALLRANLMTSYLPLESACYVMDQPLDTVKMGIERFFDESPEQTSEGQFKRFHSAFHNVINNGEDRTRSIAWTLTPFDSSKLVGFIANRVPLRYLGFTFFINALREIDDSGLQIPTNDSLVPLKNSLSGPYLDMHYGFKRSIRSIIKRSRVLTSGYEKLMYGNDMTEEYRTVATSISRYFQSLQTTRRLFNGDHLTEVVQKGIWTPNLYRILSVLMYLKQLEQRYGDKLEIA